MKRKKRSSSNRKKKNIRSIMRELALKVLYSLEHHGEEDIEAMFDYQSEKEFDIYRRKTDRYVLSDLMKKNIVDKKQKDEIIQLHKDTGKCLLYVLRRKKLIDRDKTIATMRKKDNKVIENRLFALSLIRGVSEQKDELDSLVKEFSDNWQFDRIGMVDLNILRLSIFELLNVEGIPASVSIDEAIELAKEYGTDGSYRFINGILNSLRKSKEIEKF